MGNMFYGNQCIRVLIKTSHIGAFLKYPQSQANFDSNSVLTTANLPQWGTCPVPPSVRISGNNAITSYEVNRDNSVVQVKLQEITLFPNPTTGMVKISPLVEGTYRIFNEVGRTIDAGQINETFDFVV